MNVKKISGGELDQLMKPLYNGEFSDILQFHHDLIEGKFVVTEFYRFGIDSLKELRSFIKDTYINSEHREDALAINRNLKTVISDYKYAIEQEFLDRIAGYSEFLNHDFKNDYESILVNINHVMRYFEERGFAMDFEYCDIKSYEKRYRKFLRSQKKIYKDLKKYSPTISKEFIPESKKNAFCHKEQIILLNEIGFFELEKVKNLTAINKGVLVGKLLGRDKKNSEDYIRDANPDSLKNREDNPYRHPSYIENIKSFLKGINYTR